MDYNVVIATPGFLEGDRFIYNTTTAATGSVYYSPRPEEQEIMQIQEQVITNRSQFERLENAECIRTYANDLITNRRNVIVVSEDISTPANGSVLAVAIAHTAMPSFSSYEWICPLSSYNYVRPLMSCQQQVAKGLIDPGHWTPANVTTQYCLSQRVEEQCGFHANIAIIWTVVVCNVVKLLIMLFLAYSRGLETPLLTVGDSVASFMAKPDTTTEDLGPITIRSVKALGREKTSDPSKTWSPDKASRWQPSNRLRWFHAVSIQRWCFTVA